MCESGHTWRRAFEAVPAQARALRQWAAVRAGDPEVAFVAGELYIAALRSGPTAVEVTLSTAGARSRLTLTGPEPTALAFDDPCAEAIMRALTTAYGRSDDARSLWADLKQRQRS